MNSNKKDKRIELRVTEEEYKKIKEEAEENNTTKWNRKIRIKTWIRIREKQKYLEKII